MILERRSDRYVKFKKYFKNCNWCYPYLYDGCCSYLFMCDRVNELESSEEEIINTTVALNLK